MSNPKVVETLKMAIIMEHRAMSLYSTVAGQTQSAEVRRIFELMAEEEKTHIEFLSKQLSGYQKTESFEKLSYPEDTAAGQVAQIVLSKKIIEAVSGAGFEAAAISAAIDLETKSIEAYSARAEEATDKNEKELYKWLADWERGHHKMLIELNRELTEKVWYDNNFWPF